MPTNPDPWPRQMQITGGTLTIYQPQVDSWDGGFLKFRAAVAVKPSDGGQEVFGVIRASAHTLVDRTARMVSLFNFSLLQIDFPSLPDHGQRYTPISARLLPGGHDTDLPRPPAGLPHRPEADGQDGGGEERSAGDHRQLSAPPFSVPVSGYPALRTSPAPTISGSSTPVPSSSMHPRAASICMSMTGGWSPMR